jgi:hypothetical protein
MLDSEFKFVIYHFFVFKSVFVLSYLCRLLRIKDRYMYSHICYKIIKFYFRYKRHSENEKISHRKRVGILSQKDENKFMCKYLLTFLL